MVYFGYSEAEYIIHYCFDKKYAKKLKRWQKTKAIFVLPKMCRKDARKLNILGALSKTTQRIFSVKGGKYPPFPLRVFGQNDFPLRGRGVPPNSAIKENSAKGRYFRSKNSVFCFF